MRDAVLEALVNDSNPGLRTQALHLLEPVRADSSVRVVLQKLAENDQNQYIRRRRAMCCRRCRKLIESLQLDRVEGTRIGR